MPIPFLIEADQLSVPYVFLNFFVQGNQVESFATIMAKQLLPVPLSDIELDEPGLLKGWEWLESADTHRSVRLYEIPGEPKLPNLSAVTSVQIILAQPGSVPQIWDAFRTELTALLIDRRVEAYISSSGALSPRFAKGKQHVTLGYTILWGASWNHEKEANSGAADWQLTKSLQSRLGGIYTPPKPVIQHVSLTSRTANLLNASHEPTGVLSLIALPLSINSGAELVYCLVTKEQWTDQLGAEWLLGPTTWLSQVDLIVHKSFYQANELNDGSPSYRILLDETIENLIHHHTQLMSELSKPVPDWTSFDQIALRTNTLMQAYPYIAGKHISLQQQLANLLIIRKQSGNDNLIFQHFTQLIQNDTENLRIYTNELKTYVDVSRTAIELVRTKQEKRDGDNLNRIQLGLAFLGAILAVLQVFDKDGAAELMKIITQDPTCTTSYWEGFLIRTCVGGIVALLVYVINYWLKSRQK